MPQTQIVTRLVNTSNNAIALQGSGISRLMDFGTNWNKVRVGILYAIDTNGITANIGSTPRFCVGVCSGVTNPLGSSSVDHWVGAISNQLTLEWKSAKSVWSRGGFTDGFLWHGAKMVGSTLSFSASSIIASAASGAPDDDKSIFVVEITKGSPSFTVQILGTTEDAANDDVLDNELKTSVEGEVLSAYISQGGDTVNTLGTSRTISVDESSDGFLNAVNIYWDNDTDRPIDVFAVAYARIN